MARLFYGKIDVTKIKKALLYEGKKGTYLNITMWENDEEDEYGNLISIQQSTKKGEDRIYIGNAKKATTSSDAQPPTDDNPPDETDDLPF